MGEKRYKIASQDLEQFLREVYRSCKDLNLTETNERYGRVYSHNLRMQFQKVYLQILFRLYDIFY